MANFVDSGYFRQRMTANMRDLGEIFERTYPKRLDFPEMSAIMYMDKYVLQGRGCSVMHPQSAVIFMEEDILSDTHKPLMLEEFLTVPILERMARKLWNEGMQRFFVVCTPQFAAPARVCFPEEAEVTLSDRHDDLMAFLNRPSPVLVLSRSALPVAQAGPGFAYAAPGHELREAWRERMTNNVQAADLVPGWLPVYGTDTLAELEPWFREGRDGN